MNQGGKKHIAAEQHIYEILKMHYTTVNKEVLCPVPNPKFTGGDYSDRPVLEYFVDVAAIIPKEDCGGCKYKHLAIEIDGAVGHKKTTKQYYNEQFRQLNIEKMYPDITFFRFDPEQIIGRGYINPKTKKIIKPFTEPELLKILGINCNAYLKVK